MTEYEILKYNYENKNDKYHLQALRTFLDRNGIKMPDQKYKYDKDNIQTWKYLDGVVKCDKDSVNEVDYIQVLNPEFIYK